MKNLFYFILVSSFPALYPGSFDKKDSSSFSTEKNENEISSTLPLTKKVLPEETSSLQKPVDQKTPTLKEKILKCKTNVETICVAFTGYRVATYCYKIVKGKKKMSDMRQAGAKKQAPYYIIGVATGAAAAALSAFTEHACDFVGAIWGTFF